MHDEGFISTLDIRVSVTRGRLTCGMAASESAQAPLGTPVTSLGFEEQNERRFSVPQEKRGLVDGLRAAAWLTTRLAVVKPLLLAAPAAKATAGLVFEELVQLLPEHVAAEVAVILGSLIARSATLLGETPEGKSCRRSAERLCGDVLEWSATAQGETMAVESSEALLLLMRALRSREAKEFYASCERATHAILRAAATPQALKLVSTVRVTLDAVIDLAASDEAAHAVREAIEAFGLALRHHKESRAQPVPEQDTLSECESDDNDDRDSKPPISNRAATKPRILTPRRKPRRRNITSLCFFSLFACWSSLALFGTYVLFTNTFYAHNADRLVEAPRPAASDYDTYPSCRGEYPYC